MVESDVTPQRLITSSRRVLLVAGSTALAGAAAAAAARPAEAANGSAVILGRTNTSSAATTISSTAPSGGAISAHATAGTAAGAYFTSRGGNGFAGGSYNANGAGVSARNYASVGGRGAAVVAEGGANTGLIASTKSTARYGIQAWNSSTVAPVDPLAGALAAVGGLGDGVIAWSSGDPEVFSPINGYHENGGTGVYGWGGIGVQGFSRADGGYGLLAQADGSDAPATMPVGLVIETRNGATDALVATGAVRITGDLFVDGTIHTTNPVDTAWVPPAVRHLRRRAMRASAKARTSLNLSDSRVLSAQSAGAVSDPSVR